MEEYERNIRKTLCPSDQEAIELISSPPYYVPIILQYHGELIDEAQLSHDLEAIKIKKKTVIRTALDKYVIHKQQKESLL